MIRVTHAFSDEPEVFDTTKFGVEDGVLHIFDPGGKGVTHIFNRDSWAALEAIQEVGGGTLWRSSQVEP
ncbi:hypothetical protein [Dietzia alimentaria]|uniref:hypothetical protein n=1 Tax=Dietzia alimentaria TaxID=665550 RepID=UPI00029B1BD6|nr:hypothetical protein [Dietzia alimentaria]